ncbi:IS1 family transposase [Candidatus Uabimicrobium helgolandensis]
MVLIPVNCPECRSIDVTKYGFSLNRKQRFFCKNADCNSSTFILDYTYNGCKSEVKQTIIDMTVNASGIHDTARVLKISCTTVIGILKKAGLQLVQVNYALLEQVNPENLEVKIEKVGEAEVDEQWSFIEKKKNQRWIWHAIDRNTGKILAYVFGNVRMKYF